MDPRELGALCDSCVLKGQTPVFSTPAKKGPKLVIVAEGPSRKEEIQGVPLVGMPGKLLDQVLEEAGISREEAYVCHSLLCRGESDKDNEQAAKACAPRLYRELAGLPNVPILALGKSAAKPLLGISSIQLARGFVWTAPDVAEKVKKAERELRLAQESGDGRKKRIKRDVAKCRAELESITYRQALAGRIVFPTVHPAFVLRSDAWRSVFQIDVNRAGKWLRGELNETNLDSNIGGSWESTDDPAHLRAALAGMGPTVSCDIETTITGSVLTSDVVCVGISDGTHTIIVDPWVPSAHAGVVSEAFKPRTVVGHNFLNFDMLALERDGVVFDKTPEDTLLAHHAYASHFPQKLDQVVSEFCNSVPWKIVFGRRGGSVASEKGGLPPAEMAPEERDFYCACDCVLTVKAWHRMQKDLDPERAVYEHDKKLALLCQGMQLGGIGVDIRAKEELAEVLEARAAGFLFKMRESLEWCDFDPDKTTTHVPEAFFGKLGARVLERSAKTGRPSTSEAVLEAYAKTDTQIGAFARDLMSYRLVKKVKRTYVDPVPILADGRAHFNWKAFGTVSGRLAGRFQSVPRGGPLPEQRVRSIYCSTGRLQTCRLVAQVHDAAIFEVGNELVYFDLAQAEARLAAYLSGDPELIKAVETDIHGANAALLFGDKPGAEDGRFTRKYAPDGKTKLKDLTWEQGGYRVERDLTKGGGFCVWYVGSADKVFSTLIAKGVQRDFPKFGMRHCQIFYDRCHAKYWRYYEYVDRNLKMVQKQGYMRTAMLGRFRWLGYFASINDASNFPIQAGIADVMNERLVEIEEKARVMSSADDVEALIRATWARPVLLRKGPIVDEDRSFILPADIKRGKRWSEL